LNDEDFKISPQDIKDLILEKEPLDEKKLFELLSTLLKTQIKEDGWAPNIEIRVLKRTRFS
jgi:hypothetical protein